MTSTRVTPALLYYFCPEGCHRSPLGILTEHHLTPTARLLWLLLFTYARSDDAVAFPSQERLAKDLGVSTETIRLRTRELQKEGWLRVRRRQGEWLPEARTATHAYVLCFSGETEYPDPIVRATDARPKPVWALPGGGR